MTQSSPRTPLTVACAPSALLPTVAPVAPAARELAPIPASVEVRTVGVTAAPVAVLTAEWAPATRLHQVQSELAQVKALMLDGINGTTGFSGSSVAKKRYEGDSGVPPRGRPV